MDDIVIDLHDEPVNLDLGDGDVTILLDEPSTSVATTTWGGIVGTLSDQVDLQAALDLKLDSASFNLSTFDTDDLSEGSTNLYDQTVTISGGSNVTIGGTYPNFTITDNSASSSDFTAHTGDSDIHFEQSEISIPASQVNDFDTEVSNNSDVSANTTHRGTTSGNPHSVSKSDVGLGNVPNVDCTNASNLSSGTIPSSVLPPIALTEVTVVSNETEQLALTAESGDVAVRSDENKTYMHNGGSAGTMADWTELRTPTDAVLSVNGETGTVVLTQDDIGDGINYVRTENNLTDALKSKLEGIEAGAEVNLVDSVNGQTGAVSLDADDIDDTSTTNKFVTASDITNLGNLSGTNTGDQDLSGLVPYSGATQNVDLGSYSLDAGDLNIENAGGEIANFNNTNGSTDITMRYGYPGYGWYWLYEGSGSGNNNKHQLWSEGAGSTDVMAYEVTQDGKFVFTQEATFNGNIVVGGTVDGRDVATDGTKLDGIESGAEVNNISDSNATDLTDAGDTSLHYHSADRNRSNHTGTQSASTISDFDTEVANNSAVVLNTAKNSYPSADATKLSGIESSADVTDEANVSSAGAEIRVDHGATAGTSRPSVSGYVLWVGSVEPTNAINGDRWQNTA